jgi:16S rRNA (uracil1498-N3)-methyltransferase
MHRFFVRPETLAASPVVLTGDQAHQIRRVLRMRPGDPAVLLDNRGQAYDAILESFGKDEACFVIHAARVAGGEPGLRVTLYQAVLKGERFEWVLQKGTEVGVHAFVPLICERNVVDDMRAIEGRRARWERIIQEAAEQSGRARLPELRPAELFRAAVKPSAPDDPQAGMPRLLAWEGERALTLRAALAGCNLEPGAGIQLYVGPEGGFTDAEAALARQYEVKTVTLGPRILRAETAGPVVVALILYSAGDI